MIHRAKDFGKSLETAGIEGAKLGKIFKLELVTWLVIICNQNVLNVLKLCKGDELLDDAYVTVDKLAPMPKWVFVAFAIVSAILLLW